MGYVWKHIFRKPLAALAVLCFGAVIALTLCGLKKAQAEALVQYQEVFRNVKVDCRVTNLTGSQSDTVTLRLRTDGAEHPAAALYQDGTWVRAQSTLDGSYLVLEAPVQGQVVLLDEGGLSPLVFILGGAGLAALLAAVWLILRHRKFSSHTVEQATNS